MKQIINENERGLLFKKGLFVKMLMPGCARYFGKAKEIKICLLYTSGNCYRFKNRSLSTYKNQ